MRLVLVVVVLLAVGVAQVQVAVAVGAMQWTLRAVAQNGADHHRVHLVQVEVLAVALLQDALLQVVAVVDVQVEQTADLGDRQVVGAYLDAFGLPDDLIAAQVFVADAQQRVRQSVDLLTVDVSFVPGEIVDQTWLCLQFLFNQITCVSKRVIS